MNADHDRNEDRATYESSAIALGKPMKLAGSSRNSGLDARYAAFSYPLPPAVIDQYSGGPVRTRSRMLATMSAGYQGFAYGGAGSRRR